MKYCWCFILLFFFTSCKSVENAIVVTNIISNSDSVLLCTSAQVLSGRQAFLNSQNSLEKNDGRAVKRIPYSTFVDFVFSLKSSNVHEILFTDLYVQCNENQFKALSADEYDALFPLENFESGLLKNYSWSQKTGKVTGLTNCMHNCSLKLKAAFRRIPASQNDLKIFYTVQIIDSNFTTNSVDGSSAFRAEYRRNNF